ncbi:MAG TPA: S8 family serine peptidase [Desulfuromonadales bacterium]|nr:S8 family serine peptidase [Desulfuromonadales bacterium]
MKIFKFHVLLTILAFALAVLTAIPAPASAATIGPKMQTALQNLAGGATVPVIVTFVDQGEGLIQAAGADATRRGAKRLALLQRLKEHAQNLQAPLRRYLQRQGVTDFQSLWLINALSFRATAEQINTISAMPEVAKVALNATVYAPETPSVTSSVATPQAVSIPWNISAVNAPELWSKGDTGQGVVVALLDTGVDYAGNSDLRGKWRSQGGWFDPYGGTQTPYDYPESPHDPDFGHGTAVAGLILGGNDIGVAPGAKWIAAKIFKDDGTSSITDIHEAFQWLLNPDDNLSTDDAPDIVNGSWGLEEINQCDTEFETDIQKLKALGVAVVFSAGNYGPDASTSISPGNYPESLAVGAVDSSNQIAIFSDGSGSSLGPSACSGVTYYPQLVAPGKAVTSYGLNNTTVTADGTSFSTPEVSGVLALLKSAFPGRSMSSLETALKKTAVPLSSSPDNTYGYGLVDANAAYNYLAGSGNSSPADAVLVAPANGASGVALPVTVRWQHPTDPDGDPVTDSVVISTSSDFSTSQTFLATTAGEAGRVAAAASGGGLILGALLAGPGRKQRRRLLTAFLLLGGLLVLYSCGGGGGSSTSSSTTSTPPAASDSLTLNSLSPATTYYWKVESSDGYGGTSESTVWHFTTQ